MTWSRPLLERLAADPALALDDEPSRPPDPARVASALDAAVAERGDDAWRRLDEVADLHDPAALDAVLDRVARPGLLPFRGRARRRRLRRVARAAITRTTRPGTLRLAAALLGAVGTDEDVPALETMAAHPAFTLHGATALADRRSHAAIAALLRLLARTHGVARVDVMDRLLIFVRQPAVRLALVRDAFDGLDDEHARHIAPIVVEELDVAGVAADPATPERMRRTARRLLRLVGRPVPPHDLGD